MATQMQRRQRQASPERWQQALQRAITGQVQVRQIGSTGQWIATSSTDTSTAHELEVTGDVVHGCSCTAAQFGDPVCCHRAMFWHLASALDLDPEPEPPASPSETVRCPECGGGGVIYVRACEVANFPYPNCPVCDGAGKTPVRIVTLEGGESTLAA